MESPDGKIIYATAEHHKVYMPMLKEHAAARIEWDIEMEEATLNPELGRSRI